MPLPSPSRFRPLRMKINALVGAAKALPAGERDRKRALLEKATAALNAGPPGRNPAAALADAATIAEQWLDMGEPERARPLLQGGNTPGGAYPQGFSGSTGAARARQGSGTDAGAAEHPRKFPALRRAGRGCRAARDRTSSGGGAGLQTSRRNGVGRTCSFITCCDSVAAWPGLIRRVPAGWPRRSTVPARVPVPGHSWRSV